MIAFCWLLFAAITNVGSAQTPRAPVYLPIAASLSTPAAGHRYLMPVSVIIYMPTRDNVNVDTAITGETDSIQTILSRIDVMNQQMKYAMEEGSRYHGYKDPNAKPALGYKIVSIVLVYERLPRSNFEVPWNPGIYRPDYAQILTRFNAKNLVEQQGVKEFWIWGYHYGDIEPAESNMASPTTGDISNSERFEDDLPIFNKTYVVYNHNYGRTGGVHNQGHQMEAIISHVNWLQDHGNTDLWWKKFVGQVNNNAPTTGRAGWTHMPPNTTVDYDYTNRTPVLSDIEDWTPDRTGALKYVSADTWDGLYNLPFNGGGLSPADLTAAKWYIYWRQNIPGIGNGIRYGDNVINDWWQFVGDWDNAITNNVGLYRYQPNNAPLAFDTNLDTYVAQSEVKNLLGYDPDGDPFTFRVVNNARFGTSEIKRDTDGRFKLFYTSLNRFYGNDRVTYVAVDKYGKLSNVATVNINFINRAPIASNGSFQCASGELRSQYVFGTDADNDALTFRLVNNPQYGTGEIKKDAQGQWRVYYQSVPNYVGPDRITFIAIDSRGTESRPPATISINVVRTSSGASNASISSQSGAQS